MYKPITRMDRVGTSQLQRFLETLDPSSIQIDNRTISDLQQFAETFAELIHYYDKNNNETSDSWQDFFLTNTQQSSPHYTLFLTFLELFQFAQDHLNTITSRQLDFHYKDVLRFSEKPAIPDLAHLVLELSKNTTSHFLEAGTLFTAGSDKEGNPLYYELTKDIVLNKARVESLKSVFVDKANGYKITAAPVANSLDGQGEPLTGDELKWSTFGESQFVLDDKYEQQERSPRTMIDANPGFALASPLLYLQEGIRSISITLNFATSIPKLNAENAASLFTAWLSGEKKWLGPFTFDKDTVIVENNETSLTFLIDLPIDFPAIIGYNDDILPEGFATDWPVIKFLMNPESPVPSKLWKTQLLSTRIKVNVEEVRNLVIQNDQTQLNPNKPFMPFGPLPTIGSTLYIGSSEVFQKKLSGLAVNIQWHDVPESLEDHYQNYVLKDTPDNYSFAGNMNILSGKRWYPLSVVSPIYKRQAVEIYKDKSENREYRFRIRKGDEIILNSEEGYESRAELERIIELVFTLGGDRSNYRKQIDVRGKHYFNLIIDSTVPILARSQEYFDTIEELEAEVDLVMNHLGSFVQGESDTVPLFKANATDPARLAVVSEDATLKVDPEAEYTRDPGSLEKEIFTNDSENGFISIELAGPKNEDFTAFGHKEYALQYIAKLAGADEIDPNKVPKTPYTPKIKSLWVDYSSEETIEFVETDRMTYRQRTDRFFHITPFGQAERHMNTLPESKQFTLLPEFENEGSFYIGIRDLDLPQTLDILFQVAEGSADPEVNSSEIQWSYLSDNNWVSLGELNILSDATNGLQTSGIISFDIPEEATSDNSLLPTGLHWLRASVAEHSSGICDMIDVKAQAATVRFLNKNNDTKHLDQPLKPDSIGKLALKDSAIKTIAQPYTSFNGQSEEQDSAFYTRVSERLRHKERAISSWDYEHLILEKFSSLYKCFCLNHTETAVSDTPGAVTIIVIPDIRNKNAVNPLQPKARKNTLLEIKKYLQKHTSPFVKLEIQNPIYEEILADFRVGFHNSYDRGYYAQLLNEDIKRFLSPWAYEDGVDIGINRSIHKSVILKFIEDLEYVDYVTQFRLYHIKRGIKHIGVGIDDMVVSEEPEFIVSMEESETIEAASANIILVSAQDHHIRVIAEGEANCAGGDPGIGQMMIDVNFEIS